jgi:peptidoglycan/xylan/chitin deacetylase (PgdA/CDA1 family)
MAEPPDAPGARMARAVNAGGARFVHEIVSPSTEGATIALTLDDGPSAATFAFLDALGGVPATFFLVGDHLTDHPEVVAALNTRGHSVGIHGWSHTSFVDLGDDELAGELTTTADVVERLSGTRPRLVRPPYGHLDARTATIVHELGFTPVLWSVDPRDWEEPGSAAIVDHTLDAAFDGAIVLLHDRPNRPDTVAAVARLATALPAAGYELVGL